MAKERKASVIYEGNASQLVYAFPFDYLRKKFVKVEDIYTNITELTIGVDYTVEDKQVRLVKGIPLGHSVKIYRETTTAPLVEWQDASVLRSADLSLQEVQLLHLAEETADKVFDSGMSTAYDNPNCWDGQYKRIINALDPIEDGDVVTLRYIKANQDSLLNQLKNTGATQNSSIIATSDTQNARLIAIGDTQNTRLNITGDTQNKRITDIGNAYVSTMTTLKDTATIKANDASNSAELSKKWAMSSSSPDGVAGNKSAKTWAEEAKEYRDIAIAGQLQADWNEEDTKAKSFIKGKPLDLLNTMQENIGKLLNGVNFVTPQLFGAKGDGETDDTAALKITVQYAYKNALKIYLPKGTYCISEPLHLYQHQTLYGNSVDNTTIKSTASDTDNNAIIVLDRSSDYQFNYGQYYCINNIALTSVNNIPYGIYAAGAAPYLDFAHLNISYVKTGISVKDTWLSSIKDTLITQIDVGIQLRVQGTSLHLENIYIIHPTKYGYEMHGLNYSEWNNVACDWATEGATPYFFAFGNVTINGLGCESEKCKTCIEQQNSKLTITGATLYFPETDTGESVFYMNGGNTLNITNVYVALAKSLSANNTAVGFKLTTNNIINITRLQAADPLIERLHIKEANSSYIHINDYTSSHSYVNKTPYLGDVHTNLRFFKDMVPYNKKMNCIYGNIYGNINGHNLAMMDGTDISWSHAAKMGDILINCKPNTGIAFQQCMNDPTLYTLKGIVTAINGSTITFSDWGFADDTMSTFARNMGTTINASGLFNNVAVASVSETDKTIVLKDASSVSSFKIGSKVTYKNNISFLRDEDYNVVQHVLAGKSEEKPTTPVTGMMYFDTALNKPVWFNGFNWVDAVGNKVLPSQEIT